MKRRVWHYGYRSWNPEWWHYVIPYRGSDEYGRLTLVFPVHPFGFVVWAYRTCRCGDCDGMREQTARWAREEALTTD